VTALMVIMAVFLVALIVDRVALSSHCQELEMKLRNQNYKENRHD
jgi:hypothetical protein